MSKGGLSLGDSGFVYMALQTFLLTNTVPPSETRLVVVKCDAVRCLNTSTW